MVDFKAQEEVVEVSYFKGIAYEEDIEAATNRCTAVLGPQGKYKWSSKGISFFNMYVFAPKYGVLWFGDMGRDDFAKVRKLAKELGTELFVVSELNISFFRNGQYHLKYHDLHCGSNGEVFSYRWGTERDLN